jgi:carbamoyl-phosphate synthase small subunit
LPALESAVLVLADGTVFRGRGVGAPGLAAGEVVFNTAITGYQEILTDPSYAGQIVTLTYPHIGNTGVNPEDEESHRVFAAGLVVRDVPALMSSWRARQTLPSYLAERNVVAIADLDTRRLTRLLREKGAQSGCVMAGAVNVHAALAAARAFPGLAGMDLAKEVTTREPYEWHGGRWALGKGYRVLQDSKYHVVAYDYGVKRNILRLLAERGCAHHRGAGADAGARGAAHEARRRVPVQRPRRSRALRLRDRSDRRDPRGDPRAGTFGICLGHQLMALACGAKT